MGSSEEFQQNGATGSGAATELQDQRCSHDGCTGTDGKDILASVEAAVKAISEKNAEKPRPFF